MQSRAAATLPSEHAQSSGVEPSCAARLTSAPRSRHSVADRGLGDAHEASPRVVDVAPPARLEERGHGRHRVCGAARRTQKPTPRVLRVRLLLAPVVIVVHAQK